jgi:hypothetical protein
MRRGQVDLTTAERGENGRMGNGYWYSDVFRTMVFVWSLQKSKKGGYWGVDVCCSILYTRFSVSFLVLIWF